MDEVSAAEPAAPVAPAAQRRRRRPVRSAPTHSAWPTTAGRRGGVRPASSYRALNPELRARVDGAHKRVPESLAAIRDAVDDDNVERCGCGVSHILRRIEEGVAAEETREFIETLVQFGGADILLSTLAFLPAERDEPPESATLTMINDTLYIRASTPRAIFGLRPLHIYPHIPPFWRPAYRPLRTPPSPCNGFRPLTNRGAPVDSA
eukprot:COSAG04_NODE_672_length_11281_cov_16.794402_8_plen_207_part_00